MSATVGNIEEAGEQLLEITQKCQKISTNIKKVINKKCFTRKNQPFHGEVS